MAACPVEPDVRQAEAPASEEMEMDEITTTVFNKLGGWTPLNLAVEVFYRRVLNDPKLARFFEGIPVRKLRRKQMMFMAFAFGGSSQFFGQHVSFAHRRLILQKGLGLEHFDAVAGHFVATLQELKVAEDLINEAAGVVLTLRPLFDADVVKAEARAIDEAINKPLLSSLMEEQQTLIQRDEEVRTSRARNISAPGQAPSAVPVEEVPKGRDENADSEEPIRTSAKQKNVRVSTLAQVFASQVLGVDRTRQFGATQTLVSRKSFKSRDTTTFKTLDETDNTTRVQGSVHGQGSQEVEDSYAAYGQAPGSLPLLQASDRNRGTAGGGALTLPLPVLLEAGRSLGEGARRGEQEITDEQLLKALEAKKLRRAMMKEILKGIGVLPSTNSTAATPASGSTPGNITPQAIAITPHSATATLHSASAAATFGTNSAEELDLASQLQRGCESPGNSLNQQILKIVESASDKDLEAVGEWLQCAEGAGPTSIREPSAIETIPSTCISSALNTPEEQSFVGGDGRPSNSQLQGSQGKGMGGDLSRGPIPLATGAMTVQQHSSGDSPDNSTSDKINRIRVRTSEGGVDSDSSSSSGVSLVDSDEEGVVVYGAMGAGFKRSTSKRSGMGMGQSAYPRNQHGGVSGRSSRLSIGSDNGNATPPKGTAPNNYSRGNSWHHWPSTDLEDLEGTQGGGPRGGETEGGVNAGATRALDRNANLSTLQEVSESLLTSACASTAGEEKVNDGWTSPGNNKGQQSSSVSSPSRPQHRLSSMGR